MKKILSFLFILLIALVFVGCGEKPDTPTPDKPDDPTVDPTPGEEVVDPTSVTISGQKSEVEVGEEFALSVKVLPAEAKEYTITWESSNPQVATVTEGKVKALSVGTTTITVHAKDVSDSFTLTVKNPKTDVEVKELYIYYSKEEFFIGESEQLSVEVDPSDASQEFVWSFDKEGIVSIDEKNVIKALKGGLVTVTCSSKANPNVKDSYEVRVYDNVEGMTIVGQGNVMKPGNKQPLTVEFKKVREDGTEIVCNSPIKWESSDTSVLTVSDDGFVTAVADGTATIRAIAQDSGAFTAEFVITVSSTEVKIGTEKYGTVKEALANSKNGDVIEIGKGSISEQILINKSGVTLKGNDSVLNGTIEIADGMTDIKFEDLTFAGAAYVFSEASSDNVLGLKNIAFNNCVFNSVASKKDGTIHFLVPVENFVFTNNNATFASNRGIRFELEAKNWTITGNTFTGVSGVLYDMIRGMDLVEGEVTISDNTFDTTAQSFIQIRYIGNATYNIDNNKFINAACVCVDLREAKLDNITKAVINVKNNEFNGGVNDWGAIRLRNSWASGKLSNPANVEVNINFNSFVGIELGENGYYVDKPTDNCTAGLFNIDHNYSDLGQPKASWFSGMAKSFDGWYGSGDDMNSGSIIDKINNDSKYIVVGTHKDITKTGYATIKEALKKATEGSIIVVLPGTYQEDFLIGGDKPNLTITSLNGEIDPNSDSEREAEAIVIGTITLAVELKGCTIKGLKFTGNSQIINNKGQSGTADNTATNLNGFTFMNNIVEVSTGGNGFIYFIEAASSYSHDLVFSGNKFKAASGFSAKAMVWIDNNYNLTVTDNVFTDITADYAFYVNDETKGLSGEYTTIENNTFQNIKGTALHINWMSPLPLGNKSCKVTVSNNKFDNVSDKAIHIGKMNNSDTYEYIQFRFNTFKKVGYGIYFLRVTGNANVSCNYNTFVDVPKIAYFYNDSKNQSTEGAVTLNAKDNLYQDGTGKTITPAASKFFNEIEYSTIITSSDEIPDPSAKATGLTIGKVSLKVGETHQLEVEYTPKNTANVGVTWSVSDNSMATITSDGVIKGLKSGKVIVTATYIHNASVKATVEIEFVDWQEVVLTFSGSGILNVDDSLTMTAKIGGSITTGEIEWSTSDSSVATVTGGKVKALKIGKVTITAKIKGTDIKQSVELQVKEKSGDSEIDKLLDLLVKGHRAVVENMSINYIGYESGYTSVHHDVYQSVNQYYAAELPSITQNPCNNGNTSGTMQSVEFIVVHDTGAASPSSNAKANSNWCVSTSNDQSSWHYTVGNDGIYQQLADTVVAWHAGDGTSWGTTTTLTNTGIKASSDLRYRAQVTLGNDGYFYVDGTKTNIKLPSGATAATGTNDLGISAIVKDGYYYLPTTHVGSGYGKKVCIRGGNLNGIGIESAVNTGSDVYLTWQRLAKLVASLLVKHNLTPDRVMFHNNFSNKTCPNTMINAGRVEMFLDMVYTEYMIAKYYSGYTVTFTSNNPDIIDNTGRVIGKGPSTATTVSYTITVTKGSETRTITLSSLVQAAK